MLVNNVGHYGGARKAFHEQSDAEWDDLYRVNLGHVFAYSRAVLPVLLEQGDGGAIVNVSTIEAFRAIPTRAVYSAFKSAITGFTRSLAVEYGRHGIRVNAIAPDVTETLQVPYSKWLTPGRRTDDPRVGPDRSLRAAARHGRRRVVPCVRPVGVRDRNDGARRRRYVGRERMVSDRGGWVDQPAASTLTVPDLAPPVVESFPRRLWRTYVTDVRASRERAGDGHHARPIARWSSSS